MSGAGTQPRFYVRDAAQADLEAVLAMKAVAWREAYGRLRDESFFAAAEASLPQQVEHWRGELERGTGLWLAEDAQGRCVGLVSAGTAREAPPSVQVDSGGTEPPAAVSAAGPEQSEQADQSDQFALSALPPLELRALYVLAEVSSTGVAEALLTCAVGDAPCRIWVLSADERARAFYRRHGFVDHGARVPKTGPWAGLDEQLMVRRGA